MLTEEVCATKSSLAKLTDPLKLYPQMMKNLRVKDKGVVMADSKVLEAVKDVEKDIAGKGRALLRQSGTEPVIRVMIESETEEKCTEYIDRIANVIIERGYCVE